MQEADIDISDLNLSVGTTFPGIKIDNLDISFDAVAKILRSLSSSSSPGPDGIPNALLKEGGPSLTAAVVSFFRQIVAKGTLPLEWKTGIIIPIFKSGSRSDCANYRPVCLTCSLCKVFERVIKESLLIFLCENDLLKDTQHGFLPRRSSCSALLNFLEVSLQL